MSPYAFAEEAAAPTAQAPSAPLAQSSVAHYLEQAFPTSTLPAIAAVPQQQQQEQEQEQEAIVGPFSADELRRWHEWDEHSYHFGLLTRPDMSFAEDMFAWAVGVYGNVVLLCVMINVIDYYVKLPHISFYHHNSRAPPSAEDDFDMVILPPRDGTPEALGPPPLS